MAKILIDIIPAMVKPVNFGWQEMRHPQEWDEQFRFDLFLRDREVKDVYEFLITVRSKPLAEKREFWLNNRPYFENLAEELWAKAQEALSEVSLDQKSLVLVADYTGHLRDTFNLLRELKSVCATEEG